MTLRDYMLIVARNWIVVAATVSAGLATALVVVFTSTATYTSSAEVLFTGLASSSGRDRANAGKYVQSRMQTYKKLGTSTNLLESVATSLGSDETSAELSDRIEIDVSQLTTVATISATDTTAKGAARTADTVASILLDSVNKIESYGPTDQNDSGSDANVTVRGVLTGKADVPTSPSGPIIPLYLLAGALVGLATSVGVVAIREVLRREASSSPGEDP